MHTKLVSILLVIFSTFSMSMRHPGQKQSPNELKIKKCADFEITGRGDNQAWHSASWNELDLLDEAEKPYKTRFKILYSERGIYLLAYCQDDKISSDYQTDQGDIWEADVFEAFFQTDPEAPPYFEYEINALNTELAILVPNNQGDFFGWAPWHYEGERKIKKAVSAEGGTQHPGANITSWTAEIFFPFALFKGLKNVPPKPGTVWKGNFYRMDYDTGERIKWSWRPIEINFHQYERFGKLMFE